MIFLPTFPVILSRLSCYTRSERRPSRYSGVETQQYLRETAASDTNRKKAEGSDETGSDLEFHGSERRCEINEALLQ